MAGIEIRIVAADINLIVTREVAMRWTSSGMDYQAAMDALDLTFEQAKRMLRGAIDEEPKQKVGYQGMTPEGLPDNE